MKSANVQRRPTGMRSPSQSRPHPVEPFCHRRSVGSCDARSEGWKAVSGGPPARFLPIPRDGRWRLVRRFTTDGRWFAFGPPYALRPAQKRIIPWSTPHISAVFRVQSWRPVQTRFLTWGTFPTCRRPQRHVRNVPHDLRDCRESADVCVKSALNAVRTRPFRTP